jgi:hypothetical protein
MNHRLNQKFLALVLIKGLVVGYTQWVGAITAPSSPSPAVRPSGLTAKLLRLATPSAFAQQDIHQF